jgi:hypothetical protein
MPLLVEQPQARDPGLFQEISRPSRQLG